MCIRIFGHEFDSHRLHQSKTSKAYINAFEVFYIKNWKCVQFRGIIYIHKLIGGIYMEKAKVYFTKRIDAESLIEIYEKVGKN